MPEMKIGLYLYCRHSSNPYHVCSEYCFNSIADTNKLAINNQPAGLKAEPTSSQPTATSVEAEKTGGCRHASNPYHVCSEYCFEVTSDTKKNEPAGLKAETKSSQPTSISTVTVQAEKTGVHRGCRHSSNPYHVCSEYCFEVTADPEKSAAKNEPAGLKAETRSSQPTSISVATVQAEKTGVRRDCRYSSNPYHVCSEYCVEVNSEPKKSTAKHEPDGLKAATKSSQPTSTSTATSVQAKKTGVHQDCRYSSNPYHICSEFCFEVTSEPKKSVTKNEPAELKAETRSSQPTSISTATSVQAKKTGVHGDCRYLSNPYHVCSEYCTEGTSEPKKSAGKNEPDGLKAKTRSSQPTSIATSVQDKKTGEHRDCRYSSNPYHVCSEFCFEVTSDPKKSAAKNEPDGLKAKTRSSQPTSIATSVQDKKTGEHRDCRYSSNPYHVCSEFCFEVTSEPKKSAAKNEPAGLKAETRSSQPTKIATSVQVKKTVVHRNCRYSSNPYHVCSEYCFEVIAEPKKLQPDSKYPSNRYHLCVEYC
ncbi:uncharacterized protein LOC143634292 isoform X2 [Bidens hawaiensis]|uniref:uncharacterized protein LOC143634292 isoform X2 n=1 Tax=Bidens hawaiensis TaxID=980011 RepID=UPI0040491AB6